MISNYFMYRYHRGQPVFVEGRQMAKFPAVISAIGNETVSLHFMFYDVKSSCIQFYQSSWFETFNKITILKNFDTSLFFMYGLFFYWYKRLIMIYNKCCTLSNFYIIRFTIEGINRMRGHSVLLPDTLF